jgi:hypothetical protein
MLKLGPDDEILHTGCQRRSHVRDHEGEAHLFDILQGHPLLCPLNHSVAQMVLASHAPDLTPRRLDVGIVCDDLRDLAADRGSRARGKEANDFGRHFPVGQTVEMLNLVLGSR